MHPYHQHKESERRAGHVRYRAYGGKVSPITVKTPSGSYETPHLGMAPASAPRPSKSNAMTADELKSMLPGYKMYGED